MNFPAVISVIVMFFVVPNMAIAGTFKWKDSAGRTHYGNELPDNISEYSEVPVYECDTEECKAELEAERSDQEKQFQELREQQIAQDKLNSRKAPASNPVFVPVVVPTPFPIPYGGTAFTRSTDNIRRPHPRPKPYQHGLSSKPRSSKSRHSLGGKRTGGAVQIRIR